jgi:glycosyltransferase involved in cell wall biosynthesis
VPPRRILFVAQLAPPSPLSAARRVSGLTRHLARLGHDVTVLTSLLAGRGPIDGARRVVRTRDLLASDLNWRRANFAALEGNAATAEYAEPSPLTRLLVPDVAAVSWLPFALPRARALARDADVVITTAPERSTHLIGLALARRGLPWVADFRDGWGFEDQRAGFAHPALARADAALERAVARAADVCIGVTEPIARDLRERLHANAVTITNGYDPDDPDLRANGAAPAAGGRDTVVHTGSLAYGGRDPAPILAALRLLEHDPATAGRVQVIFAGPVSAAERAAIEAPELGDAAQAVGSLPRPEALALQRAAGALLVITGDEQSSIATGKLYEYFAAGRPILVLGEASEAARLVREAGAGIATSASDPRRIAEALTAVMDHRDRPVGVERYSYARIAEEVAGLIERAIAAR